MVRHQIWTKPLDGKTFTNFTKDRNGLAFDDIQSITQDADGLLWLMGPYGETQISLFNPLTGATIPFEQKFGKKHIHTYLNIPQRVLGCPDGTIFFANYHPAILSSYHSKSGLKHVRIPMIRTYHLAGNEPKYSLGHRRRIRSCGISCGWADPSPI